MVKINKFSAPLLAIGFFLMLHVSCSNKKNTTLTRTYHAINTRYNVYFNANESYNLALESKVEAYDDNLLRVIDVYPGTYDEDKELNLAEETKTTVRATPQSVASNPLNEIAPSLSQMTSKFSGGTSSATFSGSSFSTTIEKCTKAIKLHSIKTKPRRDPSKRMSESYRRWLKQQEFNPFLKNVWLLLAKAEYENGEYLRSLTTLLYITKIYSSDPDIVVECKLLSAKVYTQMGWMYEAGTIFHKLGEGGGVPEKHRELYDAIYANYLVRNKEYQQAIPYLETAIKKESISQQKTRMKYLLGQLYAETGNLEMARKSYASVRGMSVKPKFEVASTLREYELSDNRHDRKKALSQLKKMLKVKRYEEYRDQIYYAAGNIYMSNQDTANAIENYEKAVKNGVNANYKALIQTRLADLYYNRRDFIKAQPHYAGALAVLKKTDTEYNRVAYRSAALDDLVIHVKTVLEQDSLQHLASLPEMERTAIIEAKIEGLKKEEERLAKAAQLDQQMQELNSRPVSSWDDIVSDKSPSTPLVTTPNANEFYFYSPQVVEQGKIAFSKKWGTRKLEDDWRRSNKTLASSFESETDMPEDMLAKIDASVSDSIRTGGGTEIISTDKYSIDYYLQQLPLTAEAITKSNELIENALFNMGKIYKSSLEDLPLSIDAFTTDLRRFPQTPNLEEIYYQLFLIYLQLGDREQMTLYRSNLLKEFISGTYATMLSDQNYEWNMRNMALMQDSIYESTYQAYLNSDIATVRKNVEEIQRKYPLSDHMSKFMLLNALTYAQTKDASGLQDNMKAIVDKYPKSDAATYATDILSRIKEGKVLLSDGSPIRGMIWNIPYEGEGASGESLANKEYSDSIATGYMLLLAFEPKTIDRNELLFQVADYNFSNYIVQTFDLSFENLYGLDILEIKGYKDFKAIHSYINRAFGEDGLLQQIDTSIMVIPVSVENYKLLPAHGLKEYMAFFEANYAEEMPHLMAYWNGHRDFIASDEELSDLPISENDIINQYSEDLSESGKTVLPPEEEISVLVMKPKSELIVPEKEETSISSSISQEIDNMKTTDSVNVVEGMKNEFNSLKYKDNLTKDEKKELKAEEKRQKELRSELKKIERLRQDSIAKVENAVCDSLENVEWEKLQEQKRIEKDRKEALKAEIKAKEDAKKQKEQERKDRQRQQRERLNEREKERQERQKEREKKRKERENTLRKR